jgi:hypothetical protein
MARGKNSRKIRVLHVAQAAVDHLVNFRGRAAAEVGFFDERRLEPAGGSFPRSTSAVYSATDDQEIESLVAEAVEITFQMRFP